MCPDRSDRRVTNESNYVAVSGVRQSMQWPAPAASPGAGGPHPVLLMGHRKANKNNSNEQAISNEVVQLAKLALPK